MFGSKKYVTILISLSLLIFGINEEKMHLGRGVSKGGYLKVTLQLNLFNLF